MPPLPKQALQGSRIVLVLVLRLVLSVSPVNPVTFRERLLVNFTPTPSVKMASKVLVLNTVRRGGALHLIRMQAVLDAGIINRFVYAII
jgi:hypothetical protein